MEETNGAEGSPFELSFSAGIAMFDPADPSTVDQLIAAMADEQMCLQKRAKTPNIDPDRPVPSSPLSLVVD